MSSIPDWPAASGPRVLTLVGNDLTIDTRARKTASSLARAGFSVIAIGIDPSGAIDRTEELDGARFVRVTPSLDSRISTRAIRLSRPELRDALRFRLEMRRQRLQMRRRAFTARRVREAETTPRWMDAIGNLGAAFSRFIGIPDERRNAVRERVNRYLRRVRNTFLLGPGRATLVADQRLTQAMTIAYKSLAKPPTSARRRGDWRRDLPELHRYEAAIGSMVDALDPDLIHCHDIFHLGLAARAKARRLAEDEDLKIVYDAHEFIAGLPSDPVRRAAYTDLESEYFSNADAVVTVSESLADLLEERYGTRPDIVMNAPDTETIRETAPLRSVAGLSEESRMITYVGGIAPHRGAETLLDSMLIMPADVHLVFVSNSTTGYVAKLLEIAAGIGIEDRVHLAPYVEPEAVVSYIRSADLSVIPLSRDVVNYEVALPNKLFQSIHAGVPVAVSDNPEMARFVTEHGVGEVFEGGNPESMAGAIMKVLEDLDHYRSIVSEPALLDSLSWQQQATSLMKVYSSLGVSAP